MIADINNIRPYQNQSRIGAACAPHHARRRLTAASCPSNDREKSPALAALQHHHTGPTPLFKVLCTCNYMMVFLASLTKLCAQTTHLFDWMAHPPAEQNCAPVPVVWVCAWLRVVPIRVLAVLAAGNELSVWGSAHCALQVHPR